MISFFHQIQNSFASYTASLPAHHVYLAFCFQCQIPFQSSPNSDIPSKKAQGTGPSLTSYGSFLLHLFDFPTLTTSSPCARAVIFFHRIVTSTVGNSGNIEFCFDWQIHLSTSDLLCGRCTSIQKFTHRLFPTDIRFYQLPCQ